MKKIIACLAVLAAILLPLRAEAQINEVTIAQITSGGDFYAACANGNITYRLFVARDANASTSCDTGGGDGTTPAICWCVDGAFVAVSAATSADLSGYVPVTKAGSQSITSTAGAVSIAAQGAAGAGDFTVTPADAFVVNSPAGGPVTFNAGAAGANGFDILGDSNGVTVYTYDATRTSFADFNSASFFFGVGTGANFAVDVASGADELTIEENNIEVGSGAEGMSVSISGDSVYVTATGLTGAACVSVQGVNFCGGSSAEPYVCDGAAPYGLYTDTDDGKLYHCNKTAWTATY